MSPRRGCFCIMVIYRIQSRSQTLSIMCVQMRSIIWVLRAMYVLVLISLSTLGMSLHLGRRGFWRRSDDAGMISGFIKRLAARCMVPLHRLKVRRRLFIRGALMQLPRSMRITWLRTIATDMACLYVTAYFLIMSLPGGVRPL